VESDFSCAGKLAEEEGSLVCEISPEDNNINAARKLAPSVRQGLGF
jgi:hypothetical protein